MRNLCPTLFFLLFFLPVLAYAQVQDDVVSMDEDTEATFSVTDNDEVPDLDVASVDLDPSLSGRQVYLNVPGIGEFEVDDLGNVTFSPTANYFGLVTQPYSVSTMSGDDAGQAQMQVTVNPVNDAPVAEIDAGTTDENTAISIDVTANDTDVDNTVDELVADLDPIANGIQISLVVNGEGTWTASGGTVTFTPESGFSGTAQISYTARDPEGAESNPATITVTVNDINANPVANDDVASTDINTAVVIAILDNDTDDDNALDPATVDLDPGTGGRQTSVSDASGSAVVNGSGVVTFTPATGFTGAASFTYTVDDNAGNTSNTATVTVTVNSTNVAPTAANDEGNTSEGTPVTFDIVSNDTDPDGTIDPASVDLDPSAPGRQDSFSHANGTASVNNSGMFTFTPNAGFVGTVTLSYTVNDNEGATSNIAQITVNVSAGNQPPVAVNDDINGTEDESFTYDLLANDTDDNGLDNSSVDLDPSANGQQTTLAVDGGTITVSSGVITYTPIANYNGTFSFSYTVRDTDGLTSNTATVNVVIAAVNDAPIAGNDVSSTTEGTAVTLNILENDSDVDGTIDPSTIDLNISEAGIQSTRTTGNGTYSVDGTGILTFEPAANYSGVAVIQYNVRDNLGLVSNNASITIDVTAVNAAPVAVDDVATTDENQSVIINILSNDTDDDAIDPTTVDLNPGTGGIQSSVTVEGGMFTVSTSGVVTFSPTPDYFGTAVATYTVNDNEGLTSNTATITVTINAVNEKPVANPDLATTDEDEPVTINVVANDTDDGSIDASTVDLNVSAAGIQNTRTTGEGTWVVDSDGIVTFTPTANYFGTASIQYTVRDNEGLTSDPASITVEIASVNDKPVAVNDSRTINEDTNAVFNVVANDTDVDGQVVASTVDLDIATPGIQSSLSVPEGEFAVDSDGVVTFVPLTNFFGSVTISYTVNDNEGATSDPATITITVNAVNDPPIANNDVENTSQNVPVTINILANDIDVDGTINPVTVDLLPSTPAVADKTRTVASGTYSVDNAGVVTFTPVASFSGTSSITYTVKDNLGATSNAATISVLVDFVNTAPVANDDNATTEEDTPVVIEILANDTDDGSLVPASVDLNTTADGIQTTRTTPEGTFTVVSGVVTFTPVLNFNGTATIQYTVEDNIGVRSEPATITVTVTPVNDPPVANNDNATTPEDTPVQINVIANDTDIDGTIDPATVDLNPDTEEYDRTASVAQGVFTANATTGIVTFTPAENFFGTASVTYNVRDNSGAKSNTATITVTITNVNNPPVFNEIADQRVLRNADTKTVTISGISAGPQETEQVLLSAGSSNTTLIPHPVITYDGFASTATLTFKPQVNQSGSAQITVKAVDAGLNEFARTFTIEVVDVFITSTPPTVALTGETYQYDITITDITDELEIVALQKPAWANLTSTGKNQATLAGVPPAGATNSTVIIQVKDGNSVVDQQEYALTINRRPTSANFGMETVEDTPLPIGADNFILAYSDPDDHPLYEIFFTRLPRHGTLSLGSNPVAAEQRIPVGDLANLVYTPAPDYAGLDTLYFKVRDQYSDAADESYAHLVITPVNDAPRITFLESEPLEVDIGREVPHAISPAFTAEDPEGDDIVSAEIGFRRPNYNGIHDLLTFNNTAKIKGVYDEALGVLTLTGAASVAEYQEAIRSVTYTFMNLQEIMLEPRTFYVILNDASAASEVRERDIKLVFNFVDLKIPQVFTPDGNGMNDLWPFATEDGLEPWSEATIRVFDQRGNLVFDTRGFGAPWDGKKDGVAVPSGTYFYVIDLKYGKISYKGTVTILRAEQ